MVELARQHQHARARDQPVARFDREHAAKGRRPDYRTVGLAADRERRHPGGNGRRRPGGRAARRALAIVRIARRTRVEIGELRRHGLAEDDCAGRPQPHHGGGIAVRAPPGKQRRAAFGRIVGGIEDVLDADRNAVQRTDRQPIAATLVERARLRERVVTVEMDEGVDLVVERRDAIEAGTDILGRRYRALRDLLGRLRCGEGRRIAVGQSFSFRTACWAARARFPGRYR